MSPYTFLVTGASSGLGAHISIAASRAGHKVVGTARNVAKAKESYPEIEQKGGHWLALDVTSTETQSIVEKAGEEHSINVVVNNAGYALRGVLEDLTYAVVALTKNAENLLTKRTQLDRHPHTNRNKPLRRPGSNTRLHPRLPRAELRHNRQHLLHVGDLR